jgi:hypothetical protein
LVAQDLPRQYGWLFAAPFNCDNDNVVVILDVSRGDGFAAPVARTRGG